VQPTDLVSGRFSCSEGREDREEDERGTDGQGLLAEGIEMKDRLLRLSITLMAIAATALAGGATVKGF
jgi:hypothetical protein